MTNDSPAGLSVAAAYKAKNGGDTRRAVRHLFPGSRRSTSATPGDTGETRSETDAAAARWPIVVALLVDPEREANRLARLLDALPTERRRHEIADDVQRRPGAGRRASADLPPGASASGGCSSDTGRSPLFRYLLTKPRV